MGLFPANYVTWLETCGNDSAWSEEDELDMVDSDRHSPSTLDMSYSDETSSEDSIIMSKASLDNLDVEMVGNWLVNLGYTHLVPIFQGMI